MEWWYKTEKYSVSTENKKILKDALEKELVESNSLETISLYDDEEFFYIRTTNNIALHSFLFRHNFEEDYDFNESIEDDLNLLYGNK
jgi:hypothetical protein